MIGGLRTYLKRFRRDETGNAVVEFAMLVPIFIFFMMASVEVSHEQDDLSCFGPPADSVPAHHALHETVQTSLGKVHVSGQRRLHDLPPEVLRSQFLERRLMVVAVRRQAVGVLGQAVERMDG